MLILGMRTEGPPFPLATSSVDQALEGCWASHFRRARLAPIYLFIEVPRESIADFALFSTIANFKPPVLSRKLAHAFRVPLRNNTAY